ncbi:MAG TPA: glutamate-cysteine ligase family protein [Nitrospiria bacterium]
MTKRTPLHLFDAIGIELEYMIVDTETLSVRPIADELLKQVGGGINMEVELGTIAWSNELALHVIELKTNGPTPTLAELGPVFHEHVQRINHLLAPMRANLLPTGMHPWMEPHQELQLWPHEDSVIYQTFNRIFNCKGHGWANLQSMHINLPFEGDEEFGRLHAAIRLILPILPAISASSPIADGKPTGFLDTRLQVYRHNAVAVPSVMGQVIPEKIFSRSEYEGKLLKNLYNDLAPLDPEGVLQYEWVNARGCIARFDRMAIEIRLIDVQECPQADIAVAAAAIEIIRALVEERWCGLETQKGWDEHELAGLLLDGIRYADDAVIDNRRYLEALGFKGGKKVKARELWEHLLEKLVFPISQFDEWKPILRVILQEGCLARRITKALDPQPSHDHLQQVYRRLGNCLAQGKLFRAEG